MWKINNKDDDAEVAENNYWGIIKTHYISHFRSDIERSGVTQNYCTEMFENLHQKVVFSTSSSLRFLQCTVKFH